MNSGKELLQAIKDKNISLLEKLLFQVNLNFYDPASNEDTPLHEAVKGGSEEIVKMILNTKHYKINALNNFNDTALHVAVMLQNKSVVKLLINNGADLNIKNNRNKSPIELAQEANHAEITKLLLEHECKSKIS